MHMKAKTLSEYKDLRRAIKRKQDQLKRLQGTMEFVTDTVTGSSQSIPYNKKVISIEGYVKTPRHVRVERTLNLLLAEEEKQYKEIEKWIVAIPTTRTREVFVMYYIQDYTFEQIGRELHIAESTARYWIHDEYIKKNCE